MFILKNITNIKLLLSKFIDILYQNLIHIMNAKLYLTLLILTVATLNQVVTDKLLDTKTIYKTLTIFEKETRYLDLG